MWRMKRFSMRRNAGSGTNLLSLMSKSRDTLIISPSLSLWVRPKEKTVLATVTPRCAGHNDAREFARLLHNAHGLYVTERFSRRQKAPTRFEMPVKSRLSPAIPLLRGYAVKERERELFCSFETIKQSTRRLHVFLPKTSWPVLCITIEKPFRLASSTTVERNLYPLFLFV